MGSPDREEETKPTVERDENGLLLLHGDDRDEDEDFDEPAAKPPGADAGSEPAALETKGDEAAHELEDEPHPPSYIFFAIVSVIAAAADLVSKEWATGALAMADPIKGGQREIIIVPGYFDLQYAQNPGGAWSMLRNLPEIWRRPFFLFVSTAASVFITSLYGRIDRRDWAMRWGLPLALGGAVGNLVDRVRHGYVVDFLHVYAKYGGKPRHWPTFNVADVWIVAGVLLMAFSLFLGRGRLRYIATEDEAEEDKDGVKEPVKEPPPRPAEAPPPASR